jgi:hypothetical protein
MDITVMFAVADTITNRFALADDNRLTFDDPAAITCLCPIAAVRMPTDDEAPTVTDRLAFASVRIPIADDPAAITDRFAVALVRTVKDA